MAPGDKHSKSYLQSREMSFNAHKRRHHRASWRCCGVKGRPFEWDGALQCPNAW